MRAFVAASKNARMFIANAYREKFIKLGSTHKLNLLFAQILIRDDLCQQSATQKVDLTGKGIEKFDRANYVEETTFLNDPEVPREISQKHTKFRDRLACFVSYNKRSDLRVSKKIFPIADDIVQVKLNVHFLSVE